MDLVPKVKQGLRLNLCTYNFTFLERRHKGVVERTIRPVFF